MCHDVFWSFTTTWFIVSTDIQPELSHLQGLLLSEFFSLPAQPVNLSSRNRCPLFYVLFTSLLCSFYSPHPPPAVLLSIHLFLLSNHQLWIFRRAGEASFSSVLSLPSRAWPLNTQPLVSSGKSARVRCGQGYGQSVMSVNPAVLATQ